MTRIAGNWLETYLDYASVTEAPKKMHFWAGVAALSGAVRRKVWIPMVRFTWYPSFYIIFVANPGVVAKTTTMDVAMDLLKQVPGINFGPSSITWQSLIVELEKCTEAFQYGEEFHTMSAMVLASGELGMLIDPQNQDMINAYIDLWDCRNELKKSTKTSGSESVESPWVTLIGCTTPHWIAANMPQSSIGGGFVSRCVFVHAEEKEKLVPYVDEVVSTESNRKVREALIEDLIHLSTIAGPLTISEEARVWGRAWYEKFWTSTVKTMDTQMMLGYAARKFTHLHKTAIILSLARGDSMVVELDDLVLANTMLLELEGEMNKVFSSVGKSDASKHVDTLVEYVKRKGTCRYDEAYQYVHNYFSDFRNFESVIMGCVRCGKLSMGQKGNEMWLTYLGI